jgi:hypothetical protein
LIGYLKDVSAQEIIEQIKALPPKDQAKVLEFARSLPLPQKSIRYATAEQVKAAGDKVVKQFDGVFRKLAK